MTQPSHSFAFYISHYVCVFFAFLYGSEIGHPKESLSE
jgi:hypothetical protein